MIDPGAQIVQDGQTRPRAGDYASGDPGDCQARNPTPNDAAAARARVVPRLAFPPCEACGQPIERRGYATVRVGAAIERGQAERLARHQGREPPRLVPWRFLHADCDPDRHATDAYFISCKRTRTAHDLLREVVKLSTHGWHQNTAWRDVVTAILAGRPTTGG